MLSLLCVDGNVPIFGKIEDGNASDKAINRRLLSETSGHMHKYGVEADAFVYFADSAMVTDANLAQLGERTLFISRLPATYNEHERVVFAAIEADDWQAVGHIAQTAPTKNRVLSATLRNPDRGGSAAQRLIRGHGSGARPDGNAQTSRSAAVPARRPSPAAARRR